MAENRTGDVGDSIVAGEFSAVGFDTESCVMLGNCAASDNASSPGVATGFTAQSGAAEQQQQRDAESMKLKAGLFAREGPPGTTTEGSMGTFAGQSKASHTPNSAPQRSGLKGEASAAATAAAAGLDSPLAAAVPGGGASVFAGASPFGQAKHGNTPGLADQGASHGHAETAARGAGLFPSETSRSYYAAGAAGPSNLGSAGASIPLDACSSTAFNSDVEPSDAVVLHVMGSACCNPAPQTAPTNRHGCCQRCASSANCEVFVWQPSSGACWLLQWKGPWRTTTPVRDRVMAYRPVATPLYAANTYSLR